MDEYATFQQQFAFNQWLMEWFIYVLVACIGLHMMCFAFELCYIICVVIRILVKEQAMRTLLFGLCVVFGGLCSQASAEECKDCDKVVIVRPFARVLVVRRSDTVVVVDRPFLFPWRSQVIVVRGK